MSHEPAPVRRHGDGRRPRARPIVLVIDDDPILRLLARETLEQAGFLVHDEGDGSLAMEAFRRARPHLVLLDVNLPGKDGYEICRELRQTSAGALTPVLMMTAPEDTDAVHRAYEAGATDFITKPINWVLLTYRVRYVLRDSARTLLRVARAVGSTLDLAEVLRRTTREVVEALGADTGTAWVRSPDGSGFLPAAGHRLRRTALAALRQQPFPAADPLVERFRQSPEPIYAIDSQADPRLSQPVFGRFPHRSLLLIPLSVSQEVVGALAIAWVRAAPRLTSDELRLADAIAQQAQVAIANARLHTQVREGDERLRHSQKMEAIGRLAGGIVHDFSNLVSVTVGHCGLLLRTLEPGDPRRRRAMEIQEACDRAATLTRQLLAFSRKRPLRADVLDLNERIMGVASMLQRVIGEHIELSVELDPELGRVKADPGQIDQVIMNLVVNARDAMPRGGRLVIATANVEVADTPGALHPDARPGQYVTVSVSDTGVGMDAATRARLFEPFFTTKEPGKGTGLGLATVYGIVQQSEGFIQVVSEPGRGSQFTIHLPRADQTAPVRVEVPDGDARPGSETVLVVEDEAPVRQLVADVLETYGYRVLSAVDGEEATGLCESASFDLLLTDLAMPRMSGIELAEYVVGRRPEVKVLYMSGAVDSVVPRSESWRDGVALLEKPFSPDALARKVRAVLDAGVPV
jgi:signal transduction histidine kinase